MNYLSPFEYNGIVTGMRFVGRENEVSRVQKLISAHKNVLLYGPPKIGKRSIVHNALKGMDLEGEGIVVCKLDLFNIRHVDKLMFRLAKGVSAALLGMLWFGICLLPHNGFKKAPTAAPLFVR